ncbi:hypothetical protein WMF45_26375 [Sorangium sp. So ce448]|uniref:hypothetical protein n=1 Tax=Sorangium sp. So ce448 TaxID=3133314 RepID=UPI003F618E3A
MDRLLSSAAVVAPLLVLVAGVSRLGAPRGVSPWTLLGLLAILCAAGARGVGGYLEARLRPGTRALPYHRLNRLVYSPLSLTLAAAVAGAALD